MEKREPTGELDVKEVADDHHVMLSQDFAPWLQDILAREGIRGLKEAVLGNCRALYGSERFKFYDIWACGDEENKNFGAVLTCNHNGVTKMLRKAVCADATVAVMSLADRIVKDSALLFTKYDVGSAWEGQQGFKNKTTGKFELDASKQAFPTDGPVDLMPTTYNGPCKRGGGDFYTPSGIPKGPRSDRSSSKRLQRSHGVAEEVTNLADFY